MKRRLLILMYLSFFWMCSPARLAIAGDDEILTIETAVSMALQGNHDLRRQELEIERSGERLAASRTRLQPKIETYVLGSHQLNDTQVRIERGMLGDLPKLGVFPSTTVTYEESRRNTLYSLVSISQPLSQRREIHTGITMAATSQELSREKTRQTRLELATQVKKTFCTLLSLAQARQANASAHELFQELVRTAGRFVEEGAAQKFDLMDAQARHAAVVARGEALRLQEESMREQFNRLLGRPLTTSFQLASLPAPLAGTATDPYLCPTCVNGLPTVRQADLQVRLTSLDQRLKQGEMRPQVSLMVNHLTGHRTAEYLPHQMTSAGIIVSWEPFDWGRRRHEVQEKRLAVSQASETAAAVRDAAQQAIHLADRRIREAEAALQAATEKRAWAVEKARVIGNRLREQAALIREALEAQAQLADCEQEYHQRILDTWISRAEREQALGVQP